MATATTTITAHTFGWNNGSDNEDDVELRLGDDEVYTYYSCAIFDITGLPADATITAHTLILRLLGTSNNSVWMDSGSESITIHPIGTLNGERVDFDDTGSSIPVGEFISLDSYNIVPWYPVMTSELIGSDFSTTDFGPVDGDSISRFAADIEYATYNVTLGFELNGSPEELYFKFDNPRLRLTYTYESDEQSSEEVTITQTTDRSSKQAIKRDYTLIVIPGSPTEAHYQIVESHQNWANPLINLTSSNSSILRNGNLVNLTANELRVILKFNTVYRLRYRTKTSGTWSSWTETTFRTRDKDYKFSRSGTYQSASGSTVVNSSEYTRRGNQVIVTGGTSYPVVNGRVVIDNR